MKQAYSVEVNRVVYIRETYLIEAEDIGSAGDKVFDELGRIESVKYTDHEEPHESVIMEQYHGTEIEFIDGPLDVE